MSHWVLPGPGCRGPEPGLQNALSLTFQSLGLAEARTSTVAPSGMTAPSLRDADDAAPIHGKTVKGTASCDHCTTAQCPCLAARTNCDGRLVSELCWLKIWRRAGFGGAGAALMILGNTSKRSRHQTAARSWPPLQQHQRLAPSEPHR